MLKSFGLITLIVFFSCSAISANLWDDAEAKSAKVEYKDGFVYRGGVDYASPYKPTEKTIKPRDTGVGCAKFDWEVNFKDRLNQKTLGGYWKSQIKTFHFWLYISILIIGLIVLRVFKIMRVKID